MLYGLGNIDFSGIGALGAITKVYGEGEIIAMATPIISGAFGDKVGELIGKIYGKYRLVRGSGVASAVSDFESDMGGPGGYVASTLGWAGAFSKKDELRTQLTELANKWKSDGIEIVRAENAVATPEAPAVGPSAAASTRTGAKGGSLVFAQSTADVSKIQSRLRAAQRARQDALFSGRLPYIIGASALVFVLGIALLAGSSD